MTKITFFVFFYLLFFTANCQTNVVSKSIDNTCKQIDISSENFKKVIVKSLLNDNNKSYTSFNVYYIDTINNRFRKVVTYDQRTRLHKTFFYENKKLIQIQIEKKAASKQIALYQFRDDKIIYNKDLHNLVKKISTLTNEAKGYLNDPVIVQ